MSQALILDNLKASLELLEQIQNTNSVRTNWEMYKHLEVALTRLHQTAMQPYLLDEIIQLVIRIAEKTRVAIPPANSLKLQVTVGSEYDDNGYSFGIVGDDCNVSFDSVSVDDTSSDTIVQEGWDWIYSLDTSYLRPWLRSAEEGQFIVVISDLNGFYAKIKEAGKSVSKEVVYNYVKIEL